MPKVLQDLQVFEEERLQHNVDWLTKFAELEQTVGPIHDDCAQKMKSKAEEVDCKSDLEQFVEQNRPKNPPPPRAQYVPFNQNPLTAPPSSTANGTDSKKKEKDKKKKKSTKVDKETSLDISRASQPPKNTPASSDPNTKLSPRPIVSQPSTPVASTPQIAPAQVNITIAQSPVQTPIPPLPARVDPPETKGDSSVKLRCIYDYEAAEENELTMKEGDIIILIDKDETGWWEGRNEEGKTGVFPSNFVEIVGQEGKTTSTLAKVKPETKCRALYDYVAEDSTELTIVEGEMLTIQYEDEGWFYGTNTRGESGNFPSNYVEILQAN